MDAINNLCPIYSDAFQKMIISSDNMNSQSVSCKIIEDFKNKYLMLPEYWKRLMCLKMVPQDINMAEEHTKYLYKQIKREAFTHFLVKEWKPCSILSLPQTVGNSHQDYRLGWITYGQIIEYNQDFIKYAQSLILCEKALKCPQKNLVQQFQWYNKHAAKPITKELFLKYEEALKLYKNLEAAGNDDKQWFECWKNVNDRSLIIINFEYRLATGLNAARKNLWKIYINFLKDDPIAMLDIYRRYCRFFISDTEMREKYRYEIERIGALPKAVTKFWIDTIKFEMDFCTLNSAYLMLEKALKAVMKKSYKLVRREKSYFVNTLESYEKRMNNLEKAHFTLMENNNLYDIQEEEEEHALKSTLRPNVYFQNPTAQNLSLPNSVLLFVLKRANHHLLKKFYFSCKYFYALWKVQLCHQIIVHPNANTSYFQQSLFIRSEDIVLRANSAKIYITHRLHYAGSSRRNSRQMLSTLIAKLYKCNAEYLDISGQDLTIQDFNYLVSSGNIQSITLNNTKIVDEKGTRLNTRLIQSLLMETGNKNACLQIY